jgi:hypothetical protein
VFPGLEGRVCRLIEALRAQTARPSDPSGAPRDPAGAELLAGRSIVQMGVDDALRAAQARSQERTRSDEDERHRREEVRRAYDAEEKAAAVAMASALRRALELLKSHNPEEIQVWAQTRIGPNRGLARGWHIHDPSYYHQYVLLDTGEIAAISPNKARRDAPPRNIDEWAESRASLARDDPSERRGTLYSRAFSQEWQADGALSQMQARLRSVERNVMDAVGQMLTRAGIKL